MNPTQTNSAQREFSFDDFYQEFLLLETSIYGLCNWLKNYEEDLYDDLRIGIMFQINRVKKMLDEF